MFFFCHKTLTNMKGNGDSERIRISDANLVDIKIQKLITKLTILKKAKFRLVIELNTTITYIETSML